MGRQDRQKKTEIPGGAAESSPECRSEQELRSTLRTMAAEDRRMLIEALKDWLHE